MINDSWESEADHRCKIPIAFRIGITLFIDNKILKI